LSRKEIHFPIQRTDYISLPGKENPLYLCIAEPAGSPNLLNSGPGHEVPDQVPLLLALEGDLEGGGCFAGINLLISRSRRWNRKGRLTRSMHIFLQ
jgi:hypothetical protein